MKTLVIFGAGPIGRMLAYEFSKDYSKIVFIDVNQPVIEAINSQKEFGITVLGNSAVKELAVRNITALSSHDSEAVDRHICEAELILTAVGINALPYVAPVIAHALTQRLKKRNSLPLFLVACENATEHNSSLLKKLIIEQLPQESQARISAALYAPDCMIDRVSIIPEAKELAEDKLRIKVEEYFQLCIEKQSLDFPSVPPGVSIVDNLEPVKKQKLFTVNAVHSLIAYYGYHFGYASIDEAINDARIQALVLGVMSEIQSALLDYGISKTSQDAFAMKVLERFKNKNLGDSIVRVARDPIRKAQNGERLVSPALINIKHGKSPAYLASGLAALYLYNNSNDIQSQAIAGCISQKGFLETVKEYSGIEKNSSLFALIEPSFYMGTGNTRSYA